MSNDCFLQSIREYLNLFLYLQLYTSFSKTKTYLTLHYSISCNICTDETYKKCKTCPNSIKFYPNNYKNLISPEMLMSNLLHFSHYKLKVGFFVYLKISKTILKFLCI